MPTTYDDLLYGARDRDDLLAMAFAGVISSSQALGRTPLIFGLSESRFKRLLNEYFPEVEIPNGLASPAAPRPRQFDDLVNLLLENRVEPTEQRAWLSYAIAAAALVGRCKLWQDMGLPGRSVLSELMRENFPKLAAANVGDVSWKEFLCQVLWQRKPCRGQGPIGGSCDYIACFGTGPATA